MNIGLISHNFPKPNKAQVQMLQLVPSIYNF